MVEETGKTNHAVLLPLDSGAALKNHKVKNVGVVSKSQFTEGPHLSSLL
jgi:hypothetical protein